MIISRNMFQIIISLENWEEKIRLRWQWNSVYYALTISHNILFFVENNRKGKSDQEWQFK